MRRWIETAAFPRGDLRQALADVDKAIAEAPTDEAALERSAAIAGHLLAARRWAVETGIATATRWTLDQHPWGPRSLCSAAHCRGRDAHAVAGASRGRAALPGRGSRRPGARGGWRDPERRIERRGRDELQRLVVESELQALRAQINPHFLFNALNAL
ncbi:MAG: histidine kinase [Bryobacterales bacterium]